MRRDRVQVALAALLSFGMVAAYLSAGGRDYQPRRVGDPCAPPVIPSATDRLELASEVALDTVQRAACTLDVSRERLTLGLLTPAAIGLLEDEEQLAPEVLDAAIRAAARQALADASSTGTITGLELAVLREAVDTVPLEQVPDLFRVSSRPCRSTAWRTTAGARRVADQIALRAVVRAACDLDTAPADVFLALASERDLTDFKRRHRLTDDAFEDLARRSLRGAVTDAEDAGAVNAITAVAFRFAIDQAPIETLIGMLQGQNLG